MIKNDKKNRIASNGMKFLQNKRYQIMAGVSKYIFVVVIAFTFLIPLLVVNAYTCSNGDIVAKQSDCPAVSIDNKSAVDINNSTNFNLSTKINNPLDKSINDIPSLIAAILQIVLVVGVPIVALAIIYTGFLFVKAQGNSEKITDAKKALAYTLIGAALLLGSWVIANAIGTTVNQIKSTS